MSTAGINWTHSIFMANDDTNPDSCTTLGVEDADVSVAIGTPFMVRLCMNNDGTANWGDTITLNYRRNGTGSFAAIGAAGTSVEGVIAYDGQPSDGTACPTQLLTGTGTYTAGIYEDQTAATASTSCNKNQTSEPQWCVVLNSAVVSATDTLDFQAVATGANNTQNYPTSSGNTWPTVTAEAAAAVTSPGVYYRYYMRTIATC